MQLSHEEIANLLYTNCTTFLINTIDSGGFPYTEIIDTPIYKDTAKNYYFYTRHDSLTLRNLIVTTNSSFSFYNPTIYKKVTLKGLLRVIPENQIHLSNGTLLLSQKEYQIVHFTSIEGLLYSDYQTHLF
ncbi:pyridoxamine 5'-phosphate oxidase family protein [Carnobacterium gallinarum]|uniref:pyridoxamine 5'-phosphate oxidase family protein n=1 Tax=Carnobacterium gallinarum TaxID=2749 RepID=UPI00054D1F26|nr:pyridoxamine 5'-phosphate oxidase family protein [Carnobacterium gallinarum]